MSGCGHYRQRRLPCAEPECPEGVPGSRLIHLDMKCRESEWERVIFVYRHPQGRHGVKRPSHVVLWSRVGGNRPDPKSSMVQRAIKRKEKMRLGMS